MTTPILGINELADGQIDQFATANEAFRALEKSTNDFLAVNLSSGNATLTASQLAGAFEIVCSGHAVARDLTIPEVKRVFAVRNSGSGTISVKRGTTTVTVSAGASKLLRSNGTANGLVEIGGASSGSVTQCIPIACSDETTALATGTAKVTFRMPFALTLTAVRASLTTAQSSGSILTIDINENGSSILSTKLTIDNTEKTSTTAATPAVISDSSLGDDAEITIDIDQVGDGTAAGLKVYLIGTV